MREFLDLRDQIQRYVKWYKKGYMSSVGECFDIGGATAGALDRFIEDDDKSPWAGSTKKSRGGNGSLMRLAPVPLLYHADLEQAVRLSGDSSYTTHGARTAVDSCRFYGLLIAKAMQGESKEALLDPNLATSGPFGDDPLHLEVLEVALRTVGLIEPEDARVVRIHDTLDVEEILVSEAYEPEIGSRDNLSAVEGPAEMEFDDQGDLLSF